MADKKKLFDCVFGIVKMVGKVDLTETETYLYDDDTENQLGECFQVLSVNVSEDEQTLILEMAHGDILELDVDEVSEYELGILHDAVYEVACEEYVYLFIQESLCNDEVIVDVTPCSTQEVALSHLATARDLLTNTITSKYYHYEDRKDDFMVEEEEGKRWFIKAVNDGYYEELKIQKSKVHTS